MTANISSFLRFKFTGKGPTNEEQDLKGFNDLAGGKGGAYAGSQMVRAFGPGRWLRYQAAPGGGMGLFVRAVHTAA